MVSIHIRPGRLLVALLALGAMLGVFAAPSWSADEKPPAPKPAQQSPKPAEQSPKPAEQPAENAASAPPARTPDQVMASLNRAMTWYRQARIVMRAVEGSGVFGPADEQTTLRLLGRAFAVARAETALLARDSSTATAARSRRAEEQKKVEAAVRQGEREVERLKARLRAEPEKRSALARQLAAAQNRLELDRARLEFFSQIRELDSPRAGTDDDLENQIDALEEAVPELKSSTAAPPVAVTATGPPSGAWAMIQRLLALQRSRGRLEDLETATNELVQRVNEEAKAARARLRPMLTRLGALAKDPTDSGKSLDESQREFRDLLERRKLLVAVVLPLREELALARRYASDLKGWNEVVDRESWQALQGLALDLLGVIVALAVILVCGVLWRVATLRYVSDGPRRRLLLTARSVVVTLAVALVLIFHFTSEMAALVTALGFAAAGIAFALQNVILAVAGYFTMVAPNGIRVGDRVSLQGPFGYVHGEVSEIGFVRIKLLELGGEPLKPTGRVVVFPNSVVFTGSFFKDPSEAPAR
jgi:Mechanosensitive ion channel